MPLSISRFLLPVSLPHCEDTETLHSPLTVAGKSLECLAVTFWICAQQEISAHVLRGR